MRELISYAEYVGKIRSSVKIESTKLYFRWNSYSARCIIKKIHIVQYMEDGEKGL